MNSTSSAGSLRKMREHARNMQETDRTTQENAGICTTPQESTGKMMGRCMKTTSLAFPAILLFPCMCVRFHAISGIMVSHCCVFLAFPVYCCMLLESGGIIAGKRKERAGNPQGKASAKPIRRGACKEAATKPRQVKRKAP